MRELGLELPTGWDYACLGDVAKYLNGRAFKSSEWEQTGKPIIRIQNLNNPRAKFNYSNDDFEERYSVKNGDLLFAWSASLGAYIWRGSEAWLNQHIFKVLPKKHITKEFLYYLINNFLNELYSKTHGSGMVHITKKNFEATQIGLPPLPEQHRIVEKIETLFSELDSGVENLKAAKVQLGRCRQSVLKSAFEGKLTEAWRREHADELESAGSLLERIKAEREAANEKKLDEWKEAVKAWEANGKEGKKPAKPKKLKDFSPFSPEDEKQFTVIPKEWQRVKLEWLGEVQLGRQRSPKHISNKYPTKYIRAANITEQGISTSDVLDMEFTPDEFKRYVMKDDDIVVAEASGSPNQVGKPAIWKSQIENCCFQNTVIRLRPFIRMSEYIFWHLKYLYISGTLAKLAGGVGINHLSAGTLASIVSPICSLDEQHQMVNEIESRLSEADAMEKAIDESLQKAERLRQSILKKAFEGKLVPQDENDERASEILKRINVRKEIK